MNMSSNLPVKNWAPSANFSQGLGDDGVVSGEQLIWKHGYMAKIGDGLGNEMDMTEVISLLKQLKAANNA